MAFTFAFCPACGAKLPDPARFCPACGLQLASLSLGTQPARSAGWLTKHYVVLALIAFAIWLPAWEIQSWRSGTRPTQAFSEASAAQQVDTPPPALADPELHKLEVAAQNNPKDLEAQQVFAGALVEKLRHADNPPQDLVFASIEALDTVLKMKPDDSDALIAMADISFNQQVFPKAVDYYARYLGVAPNDNDARARYASSLTFTGKYDDAIKELNSVLSKDPKNFHAAAYLSITYAQMGKQKEALSAGEKALTVAPTDEARARFTEFLEDVKKGPLKNALPQQENPRGTTADGSAAGKLAEAVKANPVAGPKFVAAKDEGNGVVALYFQAFPMDQMPPFVREKFINGIKLKASDLNIQTVTFVDQDTGQEMARAAVKGNP